MTESDRRAVAAASHREIAGEWPLQPEIEKSFHVPVRVLSGGDGHAAADVEVLLQELVLVGEGQAEDVTALEFNLETGVHGSTTQDVPLEQLQVGEVSLEGEAPNRLN